MAIIPSTGAVHQDEPREVGRAEQLVDHQRVLADDLQYTVNSAQSSASPKRTVGDQLGGVGQPFRTALLGDRLKPASLVNPIEIDNHFDFDCRNERPPAPHALFDIGIRGIAGEKPRTRRPPGWVKDPTDVQRMSRFASISARR